LGDDRAGSFPENARTYVDQIMITIDGPNFQDFQEAEVLRLPEEGEPIETKYGTCVVTSVEALPASEHFAGKVTCRMS
jgi:hypothetical protein